MKKFRFKSLSLLSQTEKKARHVVFSPHSNLIVGENHTGKSSLIKSLYEALGAHPAGDLDRWDKGTVALMSFAIDDTQYSLLQQRSYRALFDSSNRVIFAATNWSDWGAKFVEVMNFNLVLIGQDQQPT